MTDIQSFRVGQQLRPDVMTPYDKDGGQMNRSTSERLPSLSLYGRSDLLRWFQVLDLAVLLAMGVGVYFLALWSRWGGDVPPALWTQARYAAAGGALGLLVGGSLVDLWGRQRSVAFVVYAAGVASLSSVLVGMAATYGFRAVSLPRLTFAWAAVLLWVAIVVWKGVSGAVLGRWNAVRVCNTTREHILDSSGLAQLTEDGRATLQGVILLPTAREVILASSRLMEDSGRLFLEIRARACDWPAVVLKRSIDIVISLVGLVVLAPVYLTAMLAIRLDSPGPVLYRQIRVGQGGRCFELIKLRTMVDRAEEQTGPVLASRNDSRITRVGRWLRAFRIDEIPQLVNVLRGEMSIVGPRPERPEFVQEFRKTIEGYDLRHLVKPGITGLAQVYGDYDAAAEDKLRFDLVYVFLWNPVLELKIILQTIGIMLTPERALGSRTRPAPPQARVNEPALGGHSVVEAAAATDGVGHRGGTQEERAPVHVDGRRTR